jgi:phosphotransferase system enzyme I (PtsI)
MIKMTVENAHKAGIRVAICGDIAGDVNLTKGFAEMGVDELSVPAILIPRLV